MSAPPGMSTKLPAKNVKLDRYKDLRITWRDDTTSVYTIAELRRLCPCASCRELRETPRDPLRVVQPNEPTADVHIVKMQPVGHYALGFEFSDGHATGIYGYEFLIDLESRLQNE